MNNNQIQLRPADLKDVHGEPRAFDLRIAERLGFAQSANIRKLIKRNANILEMHGNLILSKAERNQDNTPKAGRPESGYWLNEAQTVALAFLSSAPDAVAFQKEVIAVWQAYRRGELGPALTPADVQELDAHTRQVMGGITKGIVNKRIEELEASLPRMMQEAMEDALSRRFGMFMPEPRPRYVEEPAAAAASKAEERLFSSRDVLEHAGIHGMPGWNRGNLSQTVASMLLAKCLKAGIKIESAAFTDGHGRKRMQLLFSPAVVYEWLSKDGGEDFVKAKREAARLKQQRSKTGQPDLSLVLGAPRDPKQAS